MFLCGSKQTLNKMKRIYTLLAVLFMLPIGLLAQVTTSGLSGLVRDRAGNALAGATIVATHIPTGSVYQTQSNAKGNFNLTNMNPGGPYRTVVTFVGLETKTEEGFYLTLGESFELNTTMSEKSEILSAVTVVSSRRATTNGNETNIGRERIAVTPTVGRNLSDFIRNTPQAKINGQSISLGGQNNRFNSFLIDGAVNNDVFGLSASGTNGGQAGTPPISIDAIDQIIVQASPFDASVGNFTGGAINAITKGGTNDFHGSVYYVFRNQNLAGKTPSFNTPDSLRKQYPDFKNQTYGYTFGGPIVKDKAFFFMNLEFQKDNRPQPYTGPVNSSVLDSISKVVNFLKTNYNYDPGDWRNNEDKIDRTNLNTRFDFNINRNNQLTASYRYTTAERINANRSSYNGSAGTINFVNGAQLFPSKTHSGNVELKTRFSNKANNKFRVSLTNVNDDRGFVGDPFPNIFIAAFNGNPSYNIGSEISSTANALRQRILNFYDVFKLNYGKNTISIGTDIDFNKSYNLFVNRNFGAYTYSALGPLNAQLSPITAFTQGRSPSAYRRSYSLVDSDPRKGGDDNGIKAAANFESVRLGFFINDDIRVNGNLTITAGLRADRTSFTTTPPADRFFNDTAKRIISNFYDVANAVSGDKFNPRFIFSPRFGFKLNIPNQNVIIRGGAGIFSGRTPLVWPGGIYQNTGNLIGEVNVSAANNAAGLQNPNYNGGVQFNGAALPFRPDINNQYTQTDFGLPANLLTPQGDLNVIDRNFKLPTVFKTSLGLDKKLGKGWTLTTEASFTKNIYEVDWKNVNFAPNSGLRLTGPDTREINNTAATFGTNVPTRFNYRATGNATVRNPYGNIIYITNSKGPKGFAYSGTVQIEKVYDKGFQFTTAYTYGNSVVNNEGTSSVNVSNWSFMETISGRNNLTRSTSDFDLGHRIFALMSKKFTYAKNHAATTITFSYNGQSGNVFSYVNGGNLVGDGVGGNDLMYIPRDRAEIDQIVFSAFTAGGVTTTAAQQRDQFETFIKSDSYLNKNRGKYAERNGARLPFTNIVDASIYQDFMVKTGKTTHKLSVGLDIFNLTNLIDKGAGKQFFIQNDQAQVLAFQGYVAGTTIPQYRFLRPINNLPYVINDVQTNPGSSARWNGQATIRYTF